MIQNDTIASCDAVNLVSLLWQDALTPGTSMWNVVATCTLCIVVSFVASELSKNYSQVDKMWSIVPCIYCWLVLNDQRTLMMAFVSTIWSIRLTWNFSRRGGYKWPPWSGDEDYRWSHIQQGRFLSIFRNPHVFRLFNLVFISVYQHLLLLLITLPSLVAHIAAKNCPSSVSVLDWIATALILVLIGIESVADNQQYAFQTEKYRRIANGENLTGDFKDGFCQHGLFTIVRKPNYAAEQAIWITFSLYSVAATSQAINISHIGWILLVLLFQGSGRFTEMLSKQRYPSYAKYQSRVPLYMPGLYAIFPNNENKKNV